MPTVFQGDALIFGSRRRRIRQALEIEIGRAKRFNYHVGVLILEVAETVSRGVHDHLPGVTVNVKHFRSLLREYDMVIRTNLRRYTVVLPHLEASESAPLVRDRLLATAHSQDWGAINIGLAIFPQDGVTPRELLQAAERNLTTSVELELAQEELVPA